ncbi:uncharacterized protein [Lepeophtheirus salmonis]|uniref:uncharacterized protein n=1 Tax=Lepeophtheirus salmonis TaxID=72036 RepID=UPI001AE6BA79|nr:uncharacterized protein LOC121121194 [Lepeophtheirus salmonis]
MESTDSSSVKDEVLEALEKYDPMRMDYNDPNLNTYEGEDPSSKIGGESTYSISKAVVRLRVDNIPPSLDESGLKNLFSNYGTVLESRIFRRLWRETRGGLISFASRTEASEAIDGINEAKPLFLKVFFFKSLKDEERSEDDIASENDFIRREKLFKEFEENRGIHWDHVPKLSPGPALSLQNIIKKETERISPWIPGIFRNDDPTLKYSLSSKYQYDRKSDFLKARHLSKEREDYSSEEDTNDEDEIHEIGNFFGPQIPFHKIADYIKTRNIMSKNPDCPSKCTIPPVVLPNGQSSEVFIRLFSHESEIEMFVIKDPFICKEIRTKLTLELKDYEDDVDVDSSKGSLLGVRLWGDQNWYRALKAGDRYFLLDFGKYVINSDVDMLADLPKGFVEEYPMQAIRVNFFDDYTFSSDPNVLKKLVLIFKNKKVRVQPLGIHNKGQVLIRFEGNKNAKGKDILDVLLEEGFIQKNSTPLQLGIDYKLYDDSRHVDSTLIKGSIVFVVDFMDSINEVIVIEHNSYPDRTQFQDKLLCCQFVRLEAAYIVENRIVICKSSEDDQYCRARIISIDSTSKKVRLFLIDFGTFIISEFSSLYALNKDLLIVPPFSHVLTLKNVDRLHIFHPEVFLKSRRVLPLLRVPLTLQNVMENGKKAILRHPNGKTINELLKKKIISDESKLFGEYEGMGRLNNFNYDDCLISELCCQVNTLQEVTLLNIESPKEIFVALHSCLPLAFEMIAQIQAYCSILLEGGSYKPDVNHVCLVKSSKDGVWYRGVALDGVYNIFLPDFGIIEKHSPGELRMIDSRLMKFPFLSNHCVYKGFENIDLNDVENDLTFLKERSFTSEVQIRVLEVKDCYYIIDIPCIDAEMSALRDRYESKRNELKDDELSKIN